MDNPRLLLLLGSSLLLLILRLPSSAVHGRRLVIAAGGMFEEFDSDLPTTAEQHQFKLPPKYLDAPRKMLLAHSSTTTTTTAPKATNATTTVGTMTKKTTKAPPPKKTEVPMNKEKRREEFYRKVQSVPIQDEHALQLYQHWADQAFSNLFALISHQQLKQFAKPVHEEFGDCAKKAVTVPMHARCVSDLLKGRFDGAKVVEKAKTISTRFDRYRMKKRGEFRREMKLRGSQKDQHDWVGGFRMMRDSPLLMDDDAAAAGTSPHHRGIPFTYSAHRRERRQTGIVKKNHYNLMTPSEGRLSPMGRIAEQLMRKVLKSKGKLEKDVVPWQSTVQRVQNSALKRKEMKKRLEEDEVEDLDQLTFRGLKRQGAVSENDDLFKLAEDPKKLRKFLDKKRSEKGPKAPMMKVVNLVREGIKLGYAFAGKNTSELDDKTLKMISPRFMSVTPEDDPEHNGTIDFISPSLFSIHSDGKGVENLTSIPSLMKNIGGPMGFSSKEQQMWMDFIMEASGVIESTQRLEEELNGTMTNDDFLKHFDKEKYEREIRTKDGTPLYFTKQNVSDAFADSEEKKIDVFEVLQKNITKDQVREMNKTGYTMLSKDQLDMLYGEESPYADPELLHRFSTLDKGQVREYIERDIHALAEVKSFKITQKTMMEDSGNGGGGTTTGGEVAKVGGGGGRARRQVVLAPITFSPFILQFLNLQPIILSPIIFSPLILSPAVLGPVILSPWAFVPLVLSPRVLSPLVLSPPIFAPVILTPLALHPVILSPGVFIPFVLSPFVLSPFILSPQVFTPLILSPFALSPFILNPAAASPLVLSPFVLSPIIWSPMFLSALILSPYALSPIIQSPLIAFSVILSPSYLS